tara:strand:- start:581 stop:1561 length:981 start_codon:yes stop_codon:yes gene_type:complete
MNPQNKHEQNSTATRKPTILLDTDIGNDVDDVIALCLLLRLAQLDKVNIAGVLVSNDCESAEHLVAAIFAYYGYSVPIYKVRNGVRGSPQRYINTTLSRMDSRYQVDPEASFSSHEWMKFIANGFDADSLSLVTIGFFTNVRRILDDNQSAELLDLVAKNSFHMAGNFKELKREHNIMFASDDFEKFLTKWKKPSVYCGFEQGLRVLFRQSWLERLSDIDPIHPLVIAYFAFRTTRYDRPCWDPVTVLVACGLLDRFVSFSEPGTVELKWPNREPCTSFRTARGQYHRIVVINEGDELQIENFIKCLLLGSDDECNLAIEAIKKNR